MNIKYSYLSDGTKVKITNELFRQLKRWEMVDIGISARFLDELKKQDNDWLNSYRNYYLFFKSLEAEKDGMYEYYLDNGYIPVEKNVDYKERIRIILNFLEFCSVKQRRRFIKHFFYGMSYEEIAKQEAVSKWSVRESIKRAMNMLTFCE